MRRAFMFHYSDVKHFASVIPHTRRLFSKKSCLPMLRAYPVSSVKPILNFASRSVPLLGASVLAFLILAPGRLDAQSNLFNFPAARPGKLPVSAVTTNGNVTFSWPAMPGKWELSEQQPAGVGEWKSIPAGQYHTNGIMISATVPQPKKTAFYRVKRILGFHPPAFQNLPPVPPPPTNRPPPRPPNLPGHP
jgi:hypothetical protein